MYTQASLISHNCSIQSSIRQGVHWIASNPVHLKYVASTTKQTYPQIKPCTIIVYTATQAYNCSQNETLLALVLILYLMQSRTVQGYNAEVAYITVSEYCFSRTARKLSARWTGENNSKQSSQMLPSFLQ